MILKNHKIKINLKKRFYFNYFIMKKTLKVYSRAGEIAQELRSLAVLAEDPRSIPNTSMIAHKHL